MLFRSSRSAFLNASHLEIDRELMEHQLRLQMPRFANRGSLKVQSREVVGGMKRQHTHLLAVKLVISANGRAYYPDLTSYGNIALAFPF